MSGDRNGIPPTPAGAKASVLQRVSNRVDSNKLSLPIVLGFFCALALMCAAAAGVGYLLPHIAKH